MISNSSGTKLWCCSLLIRTAGAMLLAMGLVAPTGVASAKVTTDSYVKVHDRWTPNQESDDWIREAHAPRIAHAQTSLGSGQAVARIRNTKGKPNAAPTLVSVVEMEISGDEKKSSSEFKNRNLGFAHASAFVEIEEEVTFTQKSVRPAKSISYSLVARGRLQAYAPVETDQALFPPDTPKSFGRATAIIGHMISVKLFGQRGVAPLNAGQNWEIQVGRLHSNEAHPDNIPADIEEYDTSLDAISLDYDLEGSKRLTLRITSLLRGTVRADSPAQTADAQGDVGKTVYFGGFKFYDDLGDELPPGAYSAIGETGIDWTLSNIPDELTILDTERTQDNFIIHFTGPTEEVGWSIKGSSDLQAFTLDLTPVSTITETEPGTYHAVIDVSGQSDNLFLRVEQNVAVEAPE